MLKQAKKTHSSGSQSSLNLGGRLKATQNVPKQLLQFMARQLVVLKDIAESYSQTHPDIITSRLHECVHLMQKKLWYSLGDNPEQYHDYIQDFYENQINSLRSQLNISKIEAANRKRELEQLRLAHETLLKEKQHNFPQSDTSRFSKAGHSLEFCEENSKLKKQLDHCRMLLLQNTELIEDQAKAIQLLTTQLIAKDKQLKNFRVEYDRKIIQFDDYINKFKSQAESQMKNLASEQKNYQAQLKQITLTKIRLLDQRSSLERELETKVEEIQLLAKKILDDETVLAKYERTIVMKQKLVQDLYQELNSVNGNLNKFGKREGDYQKVLTEKNQEIVRLEERIKIINETNQKLQKKIAQLIGRTEEFQHQIDNLQKEIQQSRDFITKLEAQNQEMKRKLEQSQKKCGKLEKQIQKNEKQIKILEERYQDLFERCKQDKIKVKREILAEVNELVELVKQKQFEVKALKEENYTLKNEIDSEKESRSEADKKLAAMNELMCTVQSNINFLQNQNGLLTEAKAALETEIQKMSKEIAKLADLQNKVQAALFEKNKIIEELSSSCKKQSEHRASQNIITQQAFAKEKELDQAFALQRKQLKEIINKRDFQIRQLESKVKILQQQVRESSKLFEVQKFKMCLKVKELQQLLNERYDFSSRFSHQSEGVN